MPLISPGQAFVRWMMKNGCLASIRSLLPRGLAELQFRAQLPGARTISPQEQLEFPVCVGRLRAVVDSPTVCPISCAEILNSI